MAIVKKNHIRSKCLSSFKFDVLLLHFMNFTFMLNLQDVYTTFPGLLQDTPSFHFFFTIRGVNFCTLLYDGLMTHIDMRNMFSRINMGTTFHSVHCHCNISFTSQFNTIECKCFK